jgi:WD40 repeat protein
VLGITTNSKYAVSGSFDNTMRAWNLKNKTQEIVLQGNTDKITSIAVTSNSKYFISGSWDRTVRVWNLDSKP